MGAISMHSSPTNEINANQFVLGVPKVDNSQFALVPSLGDNDVDSGVGANLVSCCVDRVGGFCAELRTRPQWCTSFHFKLATLHQRPGHRLLLPTEPP